MSNALVQMMMKWIFDDDLRKIVQRRNRMKWCETQFFYDWRYNRLCSLEIERKVKD